MRIATLLHAREQTINDATNEPPAPDGVKTHDFAAPASVMNGGSSTKKRRRKYKVVIHTSPFLRCLQTGAAIAAGMAQYGPTSTQSAADTLSRPGSAKGRSTVQLQPKSPAIFAMDPGGSPNLLPIPEPKHDFTHGIVRRALSENKRYRKAKLRVDAFLGEWLNPEYFEHITPPPPSAMMVATAKATLMESEPVDVFRPTISNKSSISSLWGGGIAGPRPESRDMALDDWSHVQDALPVSMSARDRASSFSSAASMESNSSRRHSFRPVHGLHSVVPKPETASYVPPTPTYAVSGSQQIPKGYVAHARNACVDFDAHWDSSRMPQDWGDGGEYGEEWSSMHRRFRKGLTELISWYGEHNVDDRAEDALGFDQADRHADVEADEQEDLVVVLVTHGAGSNALMGALTGQPVLLDVGMASLTAAVRRDGVPSSMAFDPTDSPTVDGNGLRGRQQFLDLNLPSMYEMKIVASTEHLRPGADPTRMLLPISASQTSDPTSNIRPQRIESIGPGAPMASIWGSVEDRSGRGNTSTALGTIRRPSQANLASAGATPSSLPSLSPKDPLSRNDSGTSTRSSWTGGLWTPPAARTPLLTAEKIREERRDIFSQLNDGAADGRSSPGHDFVLDFANAPPENRPTSAGVGAHEGLAFGGLDGIVESGSNEERDGEGDHDHDPFEEQGQLSRTPPLVLRRGLSQRGLWGARPSGDVLQRNFGDSPKRRWTMVEE